MGISLDASDIRVPLTKNPAPQYDCEAHKRLAEQVGKSKAKGIIMKAVLEGISLSELDQIDHQYDLSEVDWFTVSSINSYTQDINLSVLAFMAGITHDEVKSLYERGDLTEERISFLKTMNAQKNVFAYQDAPKPKKQSQFKIKEKTSFQKALAEAKHHLR